MQKANRSGADHNGLEHAESTLSSSASQRHQSLPEHGSQMAGKQIETTARLEGRIERIDESRKTLREIMT